MCWVPEIVVVVGGFQDVAHSTIGIILWYQCNKKQMCARARTYTNFIQRFMQISMKDTNTTLSHKHLQIYHDKARVINQNPQFAKNRHYSDGTHICLIGGCL